MLFANALVKKSVQAYPSTMLSQVVTPHSLSEKVKSPPGWLKKPTQMLLQPFSMQLKSLFSYLN